MTKDLPTWEKFQEDLLKDVKDPKQKDQMSEACKKAKDLFESFSASEKDYVMKNNYTRTIFRAYINETKHIQLRGTNLCILCMPTYTSFEKAKISKDDFEIIENQDCDCRICSIIKDKLTGYFFS